MSLKSYAPRKTISYIGNALEDILLWQKTKTCDYWGKDKKRMFDCVFVVRVLGIAIRRVRKKRGLHTERYAEISKRLSFWMIQISAKLSTRPSIMISISPSQNESEVNVKHMITKKWATDTSCYAFTGV
ncbi:MAG: hypothetical protein ACI8RD_011898 [Bacillariaceae sp.]|jgi:hypothetical protein